MLDIHPEPYHNRLQVVSGERTTHVGTLDESSFLDTVQAVRKVLGEVLRDGIFQAEDRETFIFPYEYESADELVRYIDEKYTDARLDPEYADRARKLMSEGDSKLQMLELIQATRYRRVG